jgi:HD-like signal output (HDOD) protein
MKTLLFVDDEPKVLQGLQRQLRPMRHDWSMHFVESGDKALDLMRTTPVDVVVSDMRMPGMDGAQLLTEVSKHYPNAVRIILSGHAEREAVLRLVGPAHQYLSKPCDGEELRGAITRAFSLRDLLSNEQLKQLATRVNCLPSLPSLHAQLTEEMRKEDPSMEKIGEIISRDIGMASKVLQLVNSAFFGLPQPINSPAEAATYLGLTTVRALLLVAHVFSQFDERHANGFSLDALAGHCWRTGHKARRLAKAERQGEKTLEQCFLAGLLHDIGRLILVTGMPAEYSHVVETAREQKIPLWQAEQARFGTSHAEVGAYLLGLWRLPNPVIEAVAYHHRPAHCAIKGFAPLTAVHVADALTHERSDKASDEPGTQLDLAHLEGIGFVDRLDTWRSICEDE